VAKQWDGVGEDPAKYILLENKLSVKQEQSTHQDTERNNMAKRGGMKRGGMKRGGTRTYRPKPSKR
jgi:hypothetical protein